MIALIFATFREAAPFILRLTGAQAEDRGVGAFYSSDNHPGIGVFVCGMGPERAAETIRAFLDERKPARVINAGIAGSLSDRFHPDDMLMADRFFLAGSVSAFVLSPSEAWNLPLIRLATEEKPVFDGELRAQLAETADLVDMEGGVLAVACWEFDIPFTALKCVSDRAGEGDRETLFRNIDRLSVKIADFLFNRLLPGGLSAE